MNKKEKQQLNIEQTSKKLKEKYPDYPVEIIVFGEGENDFIVSPLTFKTLPFKIGIGK